ncbi:peptide transporter family 1 [Orussus abietinus]|uniref:peptide transporter family 1 n=1 Tax=Orussus abietinus TaxID=222816 RepID=UPI000625FDE8|nr:peptide transporter family 1 [Orussus abietinus]
MVERGNQVKTYKYPKSVFFIVGNEFCERFSYYGMRAVLVLYLVNILKYSNDTSTVIYHAFSMLVYFFPLIGAMLADSVLGKFKTIMYLSIVYTIGQLLLSASAAPPLGIPAREFSILGLILIALGTGGIKPCVAAFGGDQFVLPQQEQQLTMFFSLFYFAINSGSLLSTFVTPIFRNDVACFGDNSCYSLAFFVPAVLMVCSIVTFVLGKCLYTIKAPEGNVVLNVTKCISHGIYKKFKSKKVRQHWLDHADDEYDTKLIEDIKESLRVLTLFIPLPFFWALFDQQGSRWTIQATKMNGQMGDFVLKPDQMQMANPLLILIFIPIFESCLYPVCAKIHFINTPLRKMTVGGLLAGLAFVVSALVELQLEKTYPIMPSPGVAQLRVFNPLNCNVPIMIGNESFTLEALNFHERHVETENTVNLNYTANFAACSYAGLSDLSGKVNGVLSGTEANATSWAVTRTGIDYNYIDAVNKTGSGNPGVRVLVYVDKSLKGKPNNLSIKSNAQSILDFKVNPTFEASHIMEVDPGIYDIYLNNAAVKKSVSLKLGGVYTIVGYMSDKAMFANVTTVTQPNSLHMMWLLPQYVIITMGEVMFSVTGLAFAFTQAPVSMKSLLQAGWLLTVAFGNLIVVIIAEGAFVSSQAMEFFLFAGLMFVDMLIFGLMAMAYKYVELPAEDELNGDIPIPLESKQGNENKSFASDDEK